MKNQEVGNESTKKYSIRRRDFSILVAQSELFTCEVLSQLLKEQGYNVVGRAIEMEDTLQQIRVKRPQCVILDAEISGRRSFDIVQQIRADEDRTKFILYTSRPDLRLVARAMQTGFLGFLHANDGLEELYRCFQTVSDGGCYYSSGFMSLLENYGVGVLEKRTQEQLNRLSKREREVLHLISEGRTGNEIADQLSISYRTLTNHKTNMVKKLDLDSCRQLTRFGISIKNYL